MAFPPVPKFPNEIDDDYSLYLVYNTTETRLCQDNAPFAEEIEIVPVDANSLEIWAESGFGNIEGELFYYDSVATNMYGKVTTLKGCARNLGGSRTSFNGQGTWVRSFVIAEHHNQMVEGILQTENFIGINFDTRMTTLDWRIRNLMALSIIFDDYTCPDIDFTFNIISNSPETGIVAQYEVTVTPPGAISNFRLDFGDGQYTTSVLSGTHTYALNSQVDPIVTISNDQCSVVQSAVTRVNPNEPTTPVVPVFDIPIPNICPIPTFTVVPCVVPEPQLTVPPIVLPCFSFTGTTTSISPGPNIPSIVNILGCSNLSMPSLISVTGCTIPSIIVHDIPSFATTLVIEPPIPPTIVVVASNCPSMTVDYAIAPNIQVDWGAPPAMEVALAFAKQAKSMPMTEALHNEFGTEFADLFDANEHLKIEYETVGIPSEIKIIAPVFPKMEIDTSGIPRTIKFDTQDCNIPSEIFVRADGVLKSGIIKVDNTIPDMIEVRHSMPSTIELIGVEIPKMIEITMHDKIPDKIFVEMVNPIPERIFIEGIPEFLKVDMPTSIEVVGFPEFLPIKFPDEMPQIELVYRGAPLEMKIVMDPLMQAQAEGEEKRACFFMVPCV
jgi:hypothetical protein